VAWAQSSTTLSPWLAAIAHTRSMSTGRPNRWNGHQGLGGGGDRRLQLVEVDQIGALLHIDENGRGAHGADRFGGGKEAEGAGDHFVTGTDAQAAQGQDQGVGAAVAADREGRARAGGEVPFEGGDRAPPMY
jgi:hypothetical protein